MTQPQNESQRPYPNPSAHSPTPPPDEADTASEDEVPNTVDYCEAAEPMGSAPVGAADLLEVNPHAHSLVVSYLEVRRALGILGAMLPVILGPVGYFLMGIEIQENMSSYYHTSLRDVFVGTMCAMGIFLYCYHGYDWFENATGKLACFSAIGIGLCPLEKEVDLLRQNSVSGWIHVACGGLFFASLAAFSLIHFPRGHFGLRLIRHDARRDLIYFSSGCTIVGCGLLIGLHLFVLPSHWRAELDRWSVVFWLEWIAIWAFSSAWVVKGHGLFVDTFIDAPQLKDLMDAVNKQIERLKKAK